jgi:hypothetical protein
LITDIVRSWDTGTASATTIATTTVEIQAVARRMCTSRFEHSRSVESTATDRARV